MKQQKNCRMKFKNLTNKSKKDKTINEQNDKIQQPINKIRLSIMPKS